MPIPEPLLPEQVPDHLVKIAHQNYSMHGEGLVRNILAAVLTQDRIEQRRKTAQRVLLVSDLALGQRCPACHGKPAVRRWKSGRKRDYTCGCGHQWDAPGRIAEAKTVNEAGPWALFRKIAETGELPDLPEKTAAETASKED